MIQFHQPQLKLANHTNYTTTNMMNALAIALVLTSLLAASVWSPISPTTHNNNNNDHQDVIVKDGHRVVVVEYDKEADGSTKVVISPNDDVAPVHSNEDTKPSSEGLFSGPRELVCDAYGKCKHKMATVLGRTKDKVEETAHEVYDKAREVEEHAKDKISDKAKGGVDKAKKVAGEVVDTVKDGKEKLKNLDVVDSAKTMGGDIERNVTGKFEKVAKETVEDVKKAGEKSLGEILRNVKDVTHDVFRYMVSRDKVDAVVGLIHMLGFSTAYGMCVWVTFISSYILGRYLPRQQFGMVQSRIYPVYFKAMAYSVSAALLGHLASRKNERLTGMFGLPGLSLLSALLMVLTNMILLEPRATKAMYERMKIEKEEGRGVGVGVAVAGTGTTRDGVAEYGGEAVVRPTSTANVVAERHDVLRLNEKLKRLNTYSSALNMSTLVALTWHMANLGARLYATR